MCNRMINCDFFQTLFKIDKGHQDNDAFMFQISAEKPADYARMQKKSSRDHNEMCYSFSSPELN